MSGQPDIAGPRAGGGRRRARPDTEGHAVLPALRRPGGGLPGRAGHPRGRRAVDYGPDALAALFGAGGAIYLMNKFMRMGIEGDADRDVEEARRMFLDRYGLWPDEVPAGWRPAGRARGRRHDHARARRAAPRVGRRGDLMARILIADDDARFRGLARRTVAARGHAVVGEAADARGRARPRAPARPPTSRCSTSTSAPTTAGAGGRARALGVPRVDHGLQRPRRPPRRTRRPTRARRLHREAGPRRAALYRGRRDRWRRALRAASARGRGVAVGPRRWRR